MTGSRNCREKIDECDERQRERCFVYRLFAAPRPLRCIDCTEHKCRCTILHIYKKKTFRLRKHHCVRRIYCMRAAGGRVPIGVPAENLRFFHGVGRDFVSLHSRDKRLCRLLSLRAHRHTVLRKMLYQGTSSFRFIYKNYHTIST